MSAPKMPPKSVTLVASLRRKLAQAAHLKVGEFMVVARTGREEIVARRCLGAATDTPVEPLLRMLERLPQLWRAGAGLEERYRHPGAALPALGPQEERLLGDTGFEPLEHSEEEPVLEGSRTAFESLLFESLSVSQAARRLDVNSSRIRQRLLQSPPTLYGLKVGGEWLLPAFQFGPRGLVPEIGEVISKLPQGLHPLSVLGWFTRVNPDLVTEGAEAPLSPVDWLRDGHPVEPLADLASLLEG